MWSNLRRFIKKDFLLCICILNTTRDVLSFIQVPFFHCCKHPLFLCIFQQDFFSTGLFYGKHLGLYFRKFFFRDPFWRFPSYDKAASILALIKQLLSYSDGSFHRFNVIKEQENLIYAQMEKQKRLPQLCFKVKLLSTPVTPVTPVTRVTLIFLRFISFNIYN